jgi:hypothetical protein
MPPPSWEVEHQAAAERDAADTRPTRDDTAEHEAAAEREAAAVDDDVPAPEPAAPPLGLAGPRGTATAESADTPAAAKVGGPAGPERDQSAPRRSHEMCRPIEPASPPHLCPPGDLRSLGFPYHRPRQRSRARL